MFYRTYRHLSVVVILATCLSAVGVYSLPPLAPSPRLHPSLGGCVSSMLPRTEPLTGGVFSPGIYWVISDPHFRPRGTQEYDRFQRLVGRVEALRDQTLGVHFNGDYANAPDFLDLKKRIPAMTHVIESVRMAAGLTRRDLGIESDMRIVPGNHDLPKIKGPDGNWVTDEERAPLVLDRLRRLGHLVTEIDVGHGSVGSSSFFFRRGRASHDNFIDGPWWREQLGERDSCEKYGLVGETVEGEFAIIGDRHWHGLRWVKNLKGPGHFLALSPGTLSEVRHADQFPSVVIMRLLTVGGRSSLYPVFLNLDTMEYVLPNQMAFR